VKPIDLPPYSHVFHAGNVGDVLKHAALLAWLDPARRAPGPVHYVDTHAGEGEHALGPTGEWTEGIGPLLARARDALPPLLARYLAAVRTVAAGGPRPGRYPGSPALAARLLGPGDRLTLVERDDGTRERLAARLGADPRVTVAGGDGLAALPTAVRAAAGEAFALVDPPYSDRAEWDAVARALVAAHRAAPAARVLLWYPVKSLTRPNALLARLRGEGVPASVVELVTTPLELQRHRLNGSGLVLVNPPAGVVAEVLAAAEAIGQACATQDGRWSLRALGWT
jgi:23S rRNA (adenine2030-N6)-methyltransferase